MYLGLNLPFFPNRIITKLCLEQGVQVGPDEERQKSPGPITLTTIHRVLQDKSGVPTEQGPATATDPSLPKQPSHMPSASGVHSSQLEQRISQIEVMQYEAMQLMRDYWKYEREKDLALQKHFRANSRRFHSFPQFPQHLCESSTEDLEPEEDINPVNEATSREDEAIPEVPTAQPTTEPSTSQAKGKPKFVKQPAGRKLTLRSASSWKWKE